MKTADSPPFVPPTLPTASGLNFYYASDLPRYERKRDSRAIRCPRGQIAEDDRLVLAETGRDFGGKFERRHPASRLQVKSTDFGERKALPG